MSSSFDNVLHLPPRAVIQPDGFAALSALLASLRYGPEWDMPPEPLDSLYAASNGASLRLYARGVGSDDKAALLDCAELFGFPIALLEEALDGEAFRDSDVPAELFWFTPDGGRQSATAGRLTGETLVPFSALFALSLEELQHRYRPPQFAIYRSQFATQSEYPALTVATPVALANAAGDEQWRGSLEEFLQTNADALDGPEAERIRQAIIARRPSVLNMGAHGVFTLTPLPTYSVERLTEDARQLSERINEALREIVASGPATLKPDDPAVGGLNGPSVIVLSDMPIETRLKMLASAIAAPPLSSAP